MAGKITEFIVDFRTLLCMATLLLVAALWMGSKLEAIESRISKTQIEVIEKIGVLHSEIAQHHTALTITEKQMASLDKKLMTHLLTRGLHK